MKKSTIILGIISASLLVTSAIYDSPILFMIGFATCITACLIQGWDTWSAGDDEE